jgi:hypothetical protein
MIGSYTLKDPKDSTTKLQGKILGNFVYSRTVARQPWITLVSPKVIKY